MDDASPRRGMDSDLLRPQLDLPSSSSAPMMALPPPPPTPRYSGLAADPDTCRICRGEGASGEPLFYPCKCSGSIKFVHQDCLMEWLSHSQKKYCELCKTPFRFTKLYSPSMPKSLPVHVFFGHLAKHVFRQSLVWLRAILVASVWLFWLPYMMRAVWTFYFLFSDEGFSSAPPHPAALDTARLPYWMVGGPTPRTCPASPLFAVQITSIADIIDSDLFHGLDDWAVPSDKDPISAAFFRLLATTLRKVLGLDTTALMDSYTTSLMNGGAPRSSLLSDVPWLQNLTRSPVLNYAAAVVLEGQIISVAVIASFILIVLVRDYVVQQQPEINMRAAFAGLVLLGPNLEEVGGPALEAGREERGQEMLELGDMVDPERLGGLGGLEQDEGEQDEGEQFMGEDIDPDDYDPLLEAFGEEDNGEGDDEGDNDGEAEAGVANEDHERHPPPFREHGRPGTPQVGDESPPLLSRSSPQWSARKATQAPEPTQVHQAEPSLFGSPDRVGLADPDDHSGGEEEIPDLALNGEDKGKQAATDKGDGQVPDSWDGDVGSSGGSRPGTWSFGELPDEQAAGPHRPAPLHGLDAPQGFWGGVVAAEDAQDGVPPLIDVPRLLAPAFEPPAAAADDDVVAAAHVIPPEAPVPPPEGLIDRVANFMFAGIEPQQPRLGGDPIADLLAGADDAAANDGAAAALEEENDIAAGMANLGPEFADVEDLEDFEGIMELVGMRGPVVGLVQNALFCAVLVSLCILACVVVPYNIGRFSLWVAVNPSCLVHAVLGSAKFVQDLVVLAGGLVSWVCIGTLHLAASAFGASDTILHSAARQASVLTLGAARGVTDAIVKDFTLTASEVRNFSLLSHVALLRVKAEVSAGFVLLGRAAASAVDGGGVVALLMGVVSALSALVAFACASIKAIPGLLLDPSTWVIPIRPHDAPLPSAELAVWPSQDRALAVLCGYMTLSALAALYLRQVAPLAAGRVGRQFEAALVDILHQASGVMKVIVVIGIEMLIFPLYCGLLLDGALLPLFEGATVTSRVLFTCNYPMTSAFVHWFIGTGYMFHFALFVSMCRKVMRRGVLYFIRDPDDPDFHPVRDALERTLVTQLRNILFSAFVYGALVIVCLGGVVWGLRSSVPSLLPIHFSSNEPVLGFPIDLLFYNFAVPLAVRFFRPSASLHAMYTWWFRKCARGLRLTWFLFGERRVDEEGTLVLPADSEHRRLPWWRTVFLEARDGKVVPVGWDGVFDGGHRLPLPPIKVEEFIASAEAKTQLISSGQLVPSGRLVRTPATDQVKVPRGLPVFRSAADVEYATAKGSLREVGLDAFADAGFSVTYVPPYFGARVSLFILSIWLFAASTGVSLTIGPLMFGRWLLKASVPPHVSTNDVYAFSVGICVLGSAAYTAFHTCTITKSALRWIVATAASWGAPDAPARFGAGVLRAARLFYAYSALVVLLPLLTAALMELYVLLPLHTAAAYMSGPRDGGAADWTAAAAADDKHTIGVIQAWTLGVLYLRLGAMVVADLYGGTRLGLAVRAVLRNGMLEPDVGVLTRVFVVPGAVLGCLAIFAPALATRRLLAAGYLGQYADTGSPTAASLVVAHRLAYPAAALLLWMLWAGWKAVAVFNRWTGRIKDEAYLIGERLHNFGVASASPGRAMSTDWRAGGNRL